MFTRKLTEDEYCEMKQLGYSFLNVRTRIYIFGHCYDLDLYFPVTGKYKTHRHRLKIKKLFACTLFINCPLKLNSNRVTPRKDEDIFNQQ